MRGAGFCFASIIGSLGSGDRRRARAARTAPTPPAALLISSTPHTTPSSSRDPTSECRRDLCGPLATSTTTQTKKNTTLRAPKEPLPQHLPPLPNNKKDPPVVVGSRAWGQSRRAPNRHSARAGAEAADERGGGGRRGRGPARRGRPAQRPKRSRCPPRRAGTARALARLPARAAAALGRRALARRAGRRAPRVPGTPVPAPPPPPPPPLATSAGVFGGSCGGGRARRQQQRHQQQQQQQQHPARL